MTTTDKGVVGVLIALAFLMAVWGDLLAAIVAVLCAYAVVRFA